MYCPSCGHEITAELKYCNRCGANLSVPTVTFAPGPPVKLALPSVVMGLTIVIGLGIIFGGATSFANVGIHPAAIVWIVLFSAATLFGCVAMMIRFWTKMVTLQRETTSSQPLRSAFVERPRPQQLPPRMEPVGSVTENTTRTFSPVYREASDRDVR